jgi:hypothetical protein
MVQRIRFAAVPLALMICVATGSARAQSLEDKLRDQLRSTMDQLHQLQDAQAALQAGKAVAEQERDALKVQLAAAKAAATHTVVRAPDNTPALEAQIAQYKDAYSKASDSARQAQADHDKLQAAVADAEKTLGVCKEKNAALLKTGNEILDAYQKFDFGDAIGANEPFIGVKRVELENSAQGFGDGLYRGKFDPKASPAAPASNTGSSSKANGN